MNLDTLSTEELLEGKIVLLEAKVSDQKERLEGFALKSLKWTNDKTELEAEVEKLKEGAEKDVDLFLCQTGEIDDLKAENKKLKDGIKNVLDQKESKDDKWVMGYLKQLLTPEQGGGDV